MQSILFKAAITTLLSVFASLMVVATALPLMGGSFDGLAWKMTLLCPLVIAFPASAVTFWQNQRLAVVHERLRDAHRDLEEAHRKLNEKARVDPMTGFLNRESFFGAIEATRRRSDRGMLLIVDADHFKRINDCYGHLAGDDALIEIAAAIRSAIRSGDQIGRIGGEEFAVMLPGATFEEAQVVAERIRAQVEAVHYMPAQGKSLTLTVSIGGTRCLPDSGLSELMREADRGLYRAKNAGRNRVVFDNEHRLAA